MACINHILTRRSAYIALVACGILIFTATAFASATSASYQAGVDFGKQYAADIQSNIQAFNVTAQENRVDMPSVIAKAHQYEQSYQSSLPEKLDWMHGVADGSGVSYESILVFNTCDRNVTGFIGECTTLMAQGSAIASGKGTIIAKNRDVGFNTFTEIGMQERARHAEGDIYKAAYIDIPQVADTYKFVGSRTAGRWGYAMGVNEFQVIVGDNDANSRDTLDFEKGLHDNDVVRLVLERAKTAREGVSVVAGLVEKYGQAWNGIMFEIGDPKELWVVEVTGHRWVAKRYVNTVTARSNQYQLSDDYDLCSKDLVSFAVEQGWAKKGEKKINFRAVYGTLELYPSDNTDFQKRPSVEKLYNTEMRYQRAMELLIKAKGNIDAQTIMPMMRDHYDTYKLPSGKVIDMKQVPFYSSDYVDWYNREWMPEWPAKDTIETPMYIRGICSHDLGWGATCSTAIMVARPDVPNGLGLMLHSYMEPCTSTFVPFYVGINQIDPRYNTPQAAAVFHSISMQSFAGYTLYHDGIRAAFDPYETELFRDMPQVERQYSKLLKNGKVLEAQQLLNDFVSQKGDKALMAANIALDNMRDAGVASNAWEAR